MSMPMRLHTLLVEDSPGDVRLAQEALKECGLSYELTVVGDGEEALEYLRREGRFTEAPEPDLVLLDLSLPKIDGLEVLGEMRKDPRLESIPVVLLIVSETDPSLAKLAGVSVDCFVTKPLTPERYREALRCFPRFSSTLDSVVAEI